MLRFRLEKIGLKQFAYLLVTCYLVCFIIVNLVGPKVYRQHFIDGDGSGLYAYLPAILIYHSVDFTPVFELEKSMRSSDYQGHYFHKANGILVNKFTSGTALMQLPFFLLAWLFSVLLGKPVDGYNIFFQYATGLAAVFWSVVGLLYFVKLARNYRVKEPIVFLLALAGLLATNLFFYTFITPSASHVYSFAAIAMLLYFTRKVFVGYKRKNVWGAAFLLGLVVLIRPVNLIVVATFPFLAGSPGQFIEAVRIKIRKKDYLPAIFFFILALSPQLIINTMQNGNPFVDGYRNEGFYFMHPEFVKFLFSYRKGWFVYTPFMLLLIPAAFYLLKRSFYEMITFIGFFLLLVYVFSSWWNWLYGDSFGMRPMVDFYAFFLLVIAFLVNGLKRNFFKYLILTSTFLAAFLNLFQTYQYAEGILHPDSMTKKAYWYVFLKSGKEYRDVVADEDEYFYGKLADQPFFATHYAFDQDENGWTIPDKLYFIPDASHACIKLDEHKIYSSSYKFMIPDSLQGKRNLYVIFDAEYMEPAPNNASRALFVVDISDAANKSVFYKAFKVKRLPDQVTDTWRKAHIGFKLPGITDDMKSIKFYIWNKDKKEFYIHSLGFKFYTYSQ